MFGENTEKAKEFFGKLEEVAASRKIMGVVGGPKVEVKLKGGAKGGKGGVEMTDEILARYEEPIKSAKSKFDHQDVYFMNNMKGVNEYCGLIGKECLNDLKIDSSDKKAVADHNGVVTAIIKVDFVAFKKA